MAGPWEQYQNAPPAVTPAPEPAAGPWQQYSQPAAPVTPAPAQPPPQPAGPKPGTVDRSEIQAIADKYKVDPKHLEGIVPFFGADVTGTGEAPSFQKEVVERGAGEVSRGIALGLPQFIYKKTRPENERKAIDELQGIIEERKPLGESATELGLGLVTGGALAKGVEAVAPAASTAYNIGGGITSGAAAGLARSKEGEEVKEATIGAGIGVALGVGGHLAAKVIGRVASKAAEEAAAPESRILSEEATKLTGNEGRNIEQRVAEARAPERESDSVAAQLLTENRNIEDFNAFKKSTEEADRAKLAQPIQDIPEDEARLMENQGIRPEDQKAYKAFEQLQDDTKDFAKVLGSKPKTVEDALKVIQEKVATEGPEFIAKKFDNFKDTQKAFEILAQDLDNKLPAGNNALTSIRNKMLDGKFVSRFIDDQLGTKMEVVLDNLAQNNNKYTIVLKRYIDKAGELDKAIKQTKVDPDALYRALDKGEGLEKFSEPQLSVVNQARQVFNEGATLAKDLGVPIQMREFYVPHHSVDLAEAVHRLNQEVEKFKNVTGGVDLRVNAADPKLFDKLVKDDNFKELQQGVKFLSGREVDTPEKFQVALRSALDPALAKEDMETVASAALKREGEVPEFLIEKNVPKLISNWSQNTFRHAYYREGIDELKKIRNFAMAANDKQSASFVDTLVKDLTGVRRGTLNSAIRQKMFNIQVAAKNKLATATNPIARAYYGVLAETPDFFSQLMNQVYPNFLGFSPRAAIVNLTQPFYMTVPELGNAYGSKTMLKSIITTLNEKMAGREIRLSPEMAQLLGKEPGSLYKTRNLSIMLENEGMIPKQYSTELRNAVRQGIKDSALYRLTDAALDKYSRAAMFMFEKSESINRALSIHVGEFVARDLLRGEPAAVKFVKEMGSGYRRTVQRAVEANDIPEVERLMKNYVISKTMFNYNRASMSEFGRTLGPIFSVFTKWPASIAGDVMHIVKRKGLLKGAAKVGYKYLAPMFAVGAIEHLLIPDQKDSDLSRKLLGYGGLAGQAPIASLKQILEGRLAKPPVISALTDGVTGLVNRDPEALWKWVNNTGQAFVPGSGMVRFLTDDLPVFMGGERRKGTFLNKALPSLNLDERVRNIKQKYPIFTGGK